MKKSISSKCILGSFVLASIALFNIPAWAVEESLDLDDVKAPVAAPVSSHGASKFALMGRIDLTSETDSPNDDATHQVKNNHFLVFLKVKASPKTSFMGQIITENPNNVFYYVDYSALDFLNVQFGKILIPFGDTRRYHHIYGGVQSFGPSGVMFPNIWAESGMNLEWKMGAATLDTYVVNSAEDGGSADDPEISSSNSGERQAVGARFTFASEQRFTALLSGYSGSYSSGNGLSLVILGADFIADYGAFQSALFKHLRFSAGVASATFQDRPNEGDITQTGDYLEVATNWVGPGELRARYGTYVDNDQIESVRDTHSAALGYSLPVDVIRVLAEYQWNFEAVNEQDNDLFRLMASVDF